MKKLMIVLVAGLALVLAGCLEPAEREESRSVSSYYSNILKAQPAPQFDYSLERDLVIQLYQIRNSAVNTYTVWWDHGRIAGACPSIGYGIPYDTQLTNPLKISYAYGVGGVIEQPEPNGLYSSKNTSATWVMCVGEDGQVYPVYVEPKVVVYPGTNVVVDWENNRVIWRPGGPRIHLKRGTNRQ